MLHSRYILRLLSRKSNYRRNYASAQNKEQIHPENEVKISRYYALLREYDNKIKFNSHLEADKLKYGYMKFHIMSLIQKKEACKSDLELRQLPPLPVALKYYVEKERLLKEDNKEADIENEPVFRVVNLPYSKVFRVKYEQEKEEVKQDDPVQTKDKPFDRTNIKQWMTNYDQYDDTDLENSFKDEDDSDEEVDLEWTKNYGTPDPHEKISHTQCGGCGAFLHCKDTSIPGYVPSEIFKNANETELRTIECQRCHFLKQFNIALNVSVAPDEYEKLLSVIKHHKCLVILMVDLLDFPCSIWPGIVDIVGTQRPIVVVANKVDLLPGDSKGYLQRVRQSLIEEIKKTRLGEANIKHVCLISAKTGYGVEGLITKLFKQWLYKGDVFLVGCTNVGKSSLFNAMLQSDYCKVQAADLVKRATVSRWPGTTLNLLKFPINRPSGWKIYTREKRLRADARLIEAEKELLKSHIEHSQKLPMLIGHIGKSFYDPHRVEEDVNDLFSLGAKNIKFKSGSGINERARDFMSSRWFYDTPGVVHPDQILSLLTAEELVEALPKAPIRPQSYCLRKGSTIFIAGIARLDFIQCAHAAHFTVFCAKPLPITIVETQYADEIYEKFLGTSLFSIPKGSEERLAQWPGLSRHNDEISFIGEGNKMCCGDVILSSAGWISVTAPEGIECKVAAWTPQGRGVNVRIPSMLKYAIQLKGKRFPGTPAYRFSKPYIPDEEEEPNWE